MTIDFLIGQPDHEPPEILTEKMHEAIDMRFNSYTDQQGLKEARITISKVLEKERIKTTEKNIFVSSGSKPIAYQFLKKLNKRDKVILYSPFYPSYYKQLMLDQLNPIFVKSPQEMHDKLSEAKAAIIITPNNPDGKMWNNNLILEIIKTANQYGCQVIVDETYKDFCYNYKFSSVLSELDIDNFDNLLIIRSMSKSLSICGWRLGYGIGSKENMQHLKEIQSTILNPPSSLVQYAIARTLDKIPDSYYEGNRKRYEKKVRRFSENLKIECPDGGFYLFMDIHDKSDKITSKLETLGVKVLPGIYFGDDYKIRISIASATNDDIDNGCKIITGLIK